MPSFVGNATRSLKGLMGLDHLKCEGMIIPAKTMRFGGSNFASDTEFLHSGQREAKRLERECGLTKESFVVEIGCGTGRLPIGILSTIGAIRSYHGIDVSAAAIHWCKQHIERAHPNFRFTHIDILNNRYNPHGASMDDRWRLPVENGSTDIVYLYSVFSHMLETDVRNELKEFKRILRPGGRVFLTAFVEVDVPAVEENPQGYGNQPWKGALHCVRFDTGFFDRMIVEHGFTIQSFSHGTETDGQSSYILRA